MLLRDYILPEDPEKQKKRSLFTGFVAYYDDGKIVKEREDYFSKALNKKCATNWAEIDKDKLSKLEIVWRDEIKGFLSKAPTADSFNTNPLQPQDWFFSQKGYFDLGPRQIIVVARNIGYVESGIVNILSVIEATGIVHIYRRKA
jgi:hypothetical protein